MAGYRDSETGFDPMGRSRPATRLEKGVAVLAVIAGLLLMLSAFSGARSAPPWLHAFDWGIAPLGLVQFGMAWTYIERAGANRPAERHTRRTLRLTALALFLLGVVIIGVGVYDHFEGAH